MSMLAIHKGGSALTVTLKHRTDGKTFVGMVIWPNMGSDIFIFSNEALLCGCVPAGTDWLKYGYQYSYLLRHGNTSAGVETFDLMNHLPPDLLFVGFGSDSSRMGETALRMDLDSLRKGQALYCEIATSSGVTISGRLFRNKDGFLYILHNNSRASGSHPSEVDWKTKSSYTYSWQILEDNLKNDCTPSTYKHLGGAIELYNYDELDKLTFTKDQIRCAINIINTGHNLGARVQVRVLSGELLDGILVRQGSYYYVLHDNASQKGEQPPTRLYSKDGYRLPFSWWIDTDPLKSKQIMLDTFVLIHTAPLPMTEVDPMNPIAKNVVGGVVEPPKTEDGPKADVFASMAKMADVIPRSEPELILFKKPTAKVTRCDIQPMQSPQIITKKKK